MKRQKKQSSRKNVCVCVCARCDAMSGWRRVLRCALLSRLVLLVLAFVVSPFPDYDSSQESLLARLSDLPL